MRRTCSILLSSALLLSPFALLARSFSDVPRTSPYYADIDELSEQGAITGNPDGTFKPNVPVNRAAMLVMTYRAAGKLPTPRTTQCFARETLAEWYAAYVCDAFERQYVQGIGGDRFGADQPVTFEQAAKIVSNVFEMNVPETFSDTILNSYVHVSKTGWSAKYVAFLVREGVLPLPGIPPADFHPGDPMSRGPVASLVNKARKWRATHPQDRQQASSAMIVSSAGQSRSSAAPPSPLSASLLRSTSQTQERSVTFPFEHSSVFIDKNIISYNFPIDAAGVLDVEVKVGEGMRGYVTCQLYRIEPDGFSHDYHLGVVEDNVCYVKAAVYPGNYKVQLKPTVEDVTFTVQAKRGEGDGNDGIPQAQQLERGRVYAGVLGSGDIEDWFSLKVTQETEVTISTNVKTCLVHLGSDVDLPGFSFPQCGKERLTPGTYYFVLKHDKSKSQNEPYTIVVQ